MSMFIIGALVPWLVAGVVLGFILAPRLRSLPPRWSDAEFVRRAVEVDYERMQQ